jgi:hypothetical protein
MREAFQRLIPDRGTAGSDIVGCRIAEVRRRPNGLLMVDYGLRVRERATGREWEQQATGTILPARRASQEWERLRRTATDPGVRPSGGLPPFSFLPELTMLVQRFPFDRRLPGLAWLFGQSPREPWLPLVALFGPGDWRIEAWRAEPVRYRPEIRATVALLAGGSDHASRRSAECRLFAKVYPDDDLGERAAAALDAFWSAASSSASGFTTGRPVAYLPGQRVLLQEAVAGRPLRLSLGGGREAPSAVERAGRAVAALHTADIPIVRRRHLSDEFAALADAGARLTAALPHLDREITATIEAVCSGLDEGLVRPIHGDLKPEHLILGGDRVAFIDLDGLAGGDPLLDVAGFLTSLRQMEHRSRLPADHVRALGERFFKAYFAGVPSRWRSRYPLHHAMASLRKAARLVGKRSAGRDDSVEDFVREAAAAVRDAGR